MERFLGQTLKGRYLLNEIIGIGGMAVVYKAYDMIAARDVSVKILKDEFMRDDEFRQRFTNEFKAIALLSDENIVEIYDVCLEGEVLFIAMEYIDGVTLKEYIDSVGTLQWREATHYIKQILSAIQHAHERGVVHRDIKPHNIMLLRNGTIKVMDFGIAKVSDFETRKIEEETIGSVHYISPEQASGDALDERADIYSVGIMLYQLTTGALPFDGDNPVSVALMQIQDQPTLPREINPEIPEGLEEIILHAMMKDPLERYSEASHMLMDIETIEEDPAHLFRFNEFNISFTSKLNKREKKKKKEKEEIDIPSSEGELSKSEKKKMSTKMPILLGVLAAVCLFAFAGVGIFVIPDMIKEISNANVTVYEVPNLLNKMYEDVIKDDAYSNFHIVKVAEKPSEKPKGTIIWQSPDSPDEYPAGTTISVHVSSGVSMVSVPNLRGKTLEQARAILSENQIICDPNYVEVYDDEIRKGCVTRTNPAAGTEITVNSDVVKIYVSIGPKNARVEVPNLSGMTVKEAENKLREANLTLKTPVTEEYSDTVEAGKIISQTPAAKESVNKNTAVTVVVSKGADPNKKPEEGQIALTVTFDSGFAGKTVTVVVRQDKVILHRFEDSYDTLSGGMLSWSGIAEVGSTITFEINGTTKHTLTVESGLNNVNLTEQSENNDTDQNVDVVVTFAENYTDATATIQVLVDGAPQNDTTVTIAELSSRAFTWNGTAKVGSKISLIINGKAHSSTHTVSDSKNYWSITVEGAAPPPETPPATEPETPDSEPKQ